MKKERYIRPYCTIVPLSTTLCEEIIPVMNGSKPSEEPQFSKEHSFTLEEETTTGWENE